MMRRDRRVLISFVIIRIPPYYPDLIPIHYYLLLSTLHPIPGDSYPTFPVSRRGLRNERHGSSNLGRPLESKWRRRGAEPTEPNLIPSVNQNLLKEEQCESQTFFYFY